MLRKPIRRLLPIWIACILLFFLFTQADHFERYQRTPGDVLKRVWPSQKTLRPKDSKFPKKIWQTWKTDPLEFEERDSNRARSWPKLNPGHRYEVLTDGNDLDYVEQNFGPDGVNRPDIVETYRTLNATIIKADLLRYLVMYVEGGVYADIDVEALKPIDQWIHPDLNEADVDLVISVEIDEPNFVNHTILGQKSESFCQWTFMCKPRQPVMMRLIDHVLHWLNEVAQGQGVPIGNITLNFDEVITGTGPSAFTGAIMKEMHAQTRRHLDWEVFHNLTAPLLVGNILVLTVEAFAAGQGHSNSGNHDSPAALVKHHYHASLWPSRHPRYSHPAYGMVEECNWKPDCVKNWTDNTAVFDSLPYDDKVKLIEAHDVVNREREEKERGEKEAHEREENDRKAEDLRKQCMDAGLIPSPEPEPAPEGEGEAPQEDVPDVPDENKEQKPENEKKPEDKKPDEQKPEEQKPEEKKPEEKQPEEKKAEEKKPDDKKDAPKKDKLSPNILPTGEM